MSSHYIIRDDQAPALVIYHSSAVNEHIIHSLLEWQPRVIVEESSLGFVLHNRVNVDGIILNQMSSEEVDDMLAYQKPYDIFRPSDIPLQLIHYLAENGTKAVDLIGEFDTPVKKLAQEMEHKFPVYIYSDHSKFIHLKGGSFRKWSSAGRGFCVVPDLQNTEINNLDPLGSGNYKVAEEGIIEITARQPVWVGEIIA